MKKLRVFFNMDFFGWLNFLSMCWARIKTKFFYKIFFGSLGKGSTIFKPLLITHPRNIYIGRKVLMREGARIEIVKTPGMIPKIIIGNNVNIEQSVHIVCGSRISIEDNVTITGRVAIVDVNHPYDDIHSETKIGARVECEDNSVTIGAGAFIGFGAVILPNVKIGRHAVVGALSVVTRDIPEYSVAAGNPAKVVKKYCFETNEWVKVV